jgi:amidophosphoribosyltransferase
MSRLEELCAFRAAIALIKERGMQQVIAETYRACKKSLTSQRLRVGASAGIPSPLTSVNHVCAIYAPFTVEEINHKIVEMLCPKGMQAPIQLVYQSIEGLHEACPNHTGDWYFTGHYPTPGGIRLCNEAFINYVEKVLKNQL